MKGIFFAGLMGYLIGVFCAPKKGSELRQDMKDLVSDLKENGSDVVLDVQSKASELLDKAQPALSQVKDGAMSLKDSAMELKNNAKNSFNEAFAKGQAEIKERKVEEPKYFDPSPSSFDAGQTASNF